MSKRKSLYADFPKTCDRCRANYKLNEHGEDEHRCEPQLGMGVTQHFLSDSAPWTVTQIFSPTKIEVTEDSYIRTDKNGQGGPQEYRYVLATGERKILTLRKNGRWQVLGKDNPGYSWTIGYRHSYRDPSF